MKQARSIRWGGLVVLLVVGAFAAGGCKRRKPPPPVEPAPKAATPKRSAAPVKPPGPRAPPAPPSRADFRRVVKIKAPPRGDVDPVRADRPSLGYPVPEGLEPLKRDKVAERYQSPYTVQSLKRFFKREMKGAKIEDRAYGFMVTRRGERGFVMVTQDLGATRPTVTLVRLPRTRPRTNADEAPGN